MTKREAKYKLLNKLQLQRAKYLKRAEFDNSSSGRTYYAGIVEGIDIAIKLAEEIEE